MYGDGDRESLNFLLGVAVGSVLGAAVALLLAPDSGRRVRKQLRRKAEDLGEAAGDRVQSAAKDVRQAAEDARKAAERSGDKLKDSVQPIRKKLRF